MTDNILSVGQFSLSCPSLYMHRISFCALKILLNHHSLNKIKVIFLCFHQDSLFLRIKMDSLFHEFSNSSNEYQFKTQPLVPEISNRRISYESRFDHTYQEQNLVGEQRNRVFSVQERNIGVGDVFSSTLEVEDDDSDLSNAVLRYIDQILMFEDMEDKTHLLDESLDLQAKEMSFYEVLDGKNRASSQQEPVFVNSEIAYDFPDMNPVNSTCMSGYLSDIINPSWFKSQEDFGAPLVSCSSVHQTTKPDINSLSSTSNFTKGMSDSPVSTLHMCDVNGESGLVWNFEKGVEEASRFLPSGNNLLANLDIDGFLAGVPQRQHENGPIKMEMKSESCVKKNHRMLERDYEEERVAKLPALYKKSDVPIEEFDDVLLNFCKKFATFKLDMQNEASKDAQQNVGVKASNGRKGRGKKRDKKKEVIDLQTLLINCAQAIAADDQQNANELLKQIRKHSSAFGDGTQRLAHYFADGLEVRLAGTGSQIHKALVNKRTTAEDYLKAYSTYLTSSPFRRILKFASNKTILIESQKANKIHIIDFGIHFGFQWPNFIRRVAEREGGPPKLRITGIDFPQAGFRPAERIKETGQRLKHYAKLFNLEFEYNAIAQSWETIKLEDLKIEEDEFVVVNCINRSRNLHDETVGGRSSRTIVLNLIRRINPAIFIQGIVNGAYNAPFFVTRFREALFHFSAIFDMLENTVPRDKAERELIERDIFGREALNVIACEGRERVERPETYKQLQVRNLRAGFSQVPFDLEIMSKSKNLVKSAYHKDFVIDEDIQWLLLGWKGRIIYAISCWKPV